MRKIFLAVLFVSFVFCSSAMASGDLADVKKRGVLRHLGAPYANFLVNSEEGLDVELMQLFAKHLGVKYENVQTDWGRIAGDLTGIKTRGFMFDDKILEKTPVRGDVISSGLTIFPERKKIITYAVPTFISQIWLITSVDSDMQPIKPSGKLDDDILAVKSMLSGKTLIGSIKGSCLDPFRYQLEKTGAKISIYELELNDFAPAVFNKIADVAILDMPDVLIAMKKWPGKIKVLGPVSQLQYMAPAFRKDSSELRQEFNRFFKKIRKEGIYKKIVEKYYPAAFNYHPDFFIK